MGPCGSKTSDVHTLCQSFSHYRGQVVIKSNKTINRRYKAKANSFKKPNPFHVSVINKLNLICKQVGHLK